MSRATWQRRVDALDWGGISEELDRIGCAPTGSVLTDDECAELVDLYDEEARFRSTIDMARHRFGDGEYRCFAAVDGDYIFLNELPGPNDILNDGLGDTGDDQTWGIGRTFDITVPIGGAFRVHAGGWEADGVNDLFGRLIDPSPRCDQPTKDWFNDNLFSFDVVRNGGLDDPIGQINTIWRLDATTGQLHLDGNPSILGIGEHRDNSAGPIARDVSDTNPNNAFTLHYTIQEAQKPF